MSFGRTVLRPSLLTLLISAFSSLVLVAIVTLVFGETRLTESIQLNQWLARDIASQFSGVATQTLARAQKYGALVRAESGSFDALAQREFEADSSLRAVWVLDATGAGPLRPVAKMERAGFVVEDSQTEGVRRLTDLAIQNGSAMRGVSPGLSAVALKLGDLPRTILLFTDESLFARASGGPWGDKWILMAPSQDRTEAVLSEATSELKEGVEFPSFDEISRLVSAETPAQERGEFSSEIQAANGAAFQVSGVQTGAFGIMAIAVTPLASSFGRVDLLLQIALGVAVSISLLVMMFQIGLQLFRSRVSKKSRLETTGSAETS